MDARKIIDIVSNPFNKITSEMTLNIAKTLTDALVQENPTFSPRKNHLDLTEESKTEKNSEDDTEERLSVACGTSSASGKSPFEWTRITVVPVQHYIFYSVFTCGFAVICGVLFIFKKK